MIGHLGNLAGLLKQARSFQDNLQKMQETLARHRFEGQAGAGLVTAEVDGKGELVRIRIDPKAAGDVELLEDLVVAAVSAATKKAHEAARAAVAEMTGGLNIPGLGELLGK